MKTNQLLGIFLLVFVWPLLAHSQLKNSVLICEKGKVVSRIVISPKAIPLELLAAKEAAFYLKCLTGKEVEIVSSDCLKSETAKSYLYIAHQSNLGSLASSFADSDFADLKEGGYLIKTLSFKGKPTVVITGLTPKGALNGVYGWVEDILRRESGRKFVDVDYTLDQPIETLMLPALSMKENPYSSVSGLELDGFGLDNKSLLNPATSEYMQNCWMRLVDWCRRHKVNFISNWPYGGESMNDYPNMVILDKVKYPKALSPFSEEEIRKAAVIRRAMLKYASDNGVDPYLMTYVPGWYTSTIRKNYPQMCGEGSHGDSDGFGSKAFDWSSEAMHTMMADLAKAVVEQYPEAKGVHFRIWGGESAPDVANKHRKVELIRKIVKGMVASAVEGRKDIGFVISEYTEFADKELTYLPQLRALSPHIIIHRKWDEDWGVSNDPKIPAQPKWLNTNDGVKRAVSHSIPNEEAIPLWFSSVKLYQEGILKYVKPGEETINGWPINYRDWHTDNNDNVLNLNAIQKLSWSPFDFAYEQYYKDAFYFLFGPKVEDRVARAALLNCEAMSDFLYDYGGIVDGMDSRNYLNITKALIGKPNNGRYSRYIAHIFDKESKPEVLRAIRTRIETVLPKQQEAVRLLEEADKEVKKSREIFENMLRVNQAWVFILKSRLAAVDFVLASAESLQRKSLSDELIRLDDRLIEVVSHLTNTSAQSMFDNPEEIKRGFINQIKQEQSFMRSTYPQ